MTEMQPSTRKREPARQKLLRLLWQQGLWAVPFALFFWAMFSSWTLAGLWRSYLISLVFAYTIGFGLWFVEFFVIATLRRRSASTGSRVLIESAAYMSVVLVSAYIAAAINHIWVLPGFLGDTRAVVVNGLFAMLFSALFGGIGYAIHFYRESLHRARMVEHMRAELASAELRALRAQLHPHFLFNTLNSIASLIAVNPAEAEDTTTRLADIFRYVLTATRRDTVPLGEELAFTRDVLQIERVRFGDRLRVEESIEPGLENAQVPSLLLQPLVENAVKYGVSNRAEGGTVAVIARRDGADLVLEVSDDGPGMADATAPSGTGFGLTSVRDRLHAAGLPEALTIETGRGRGTCVRIRLPLSTPSNTTEGVSR